MCYITALRDEHCWALFSRNEANTFLSNGQRSTYKQCCEETFCEENTQGRYRDQCNTEQFRQYIIANYASSRLLCNAGQQVKITRWCPDGHSFVCADICEALGKPRCENGGTCVSSGSSWHCLCSSGYTGVICANDVDECVSSPCKNGATCLNNVNFFKCQCPPGFYGTLCDTDICGALGKPRCENGGTCVPSISSWHCLCPLGYTGVTCAIDIDECASSPCQNGATCTDYVNFFKCHCPPGFYGTLCDTGICRPLPADVVFVLDSSLSMTKSQFKKQLEFVSNFTDEVTVGHRDFQISVITYSGDAHIEFYLDQYSNNVTLKEAIANITYKPGATFTHLGLEAVKTVFGPGYGGDVPRYNSTLADRFVYLLTDGMSNDHRRSVQVANSLKQDLGVTISAIGIGVQVSHQELYDIASKRDVSGTTISSVYSVNNFNSLYTVLKELVHVTCEECSVSKKSDVIIVMQTTSKMSDMQVLLSKNALTYLLQRAELGENETKISLLTYDTNINTEFDFDKYNRSLEMLATINQVSQSSANSEIGVDAVLKYTQEHVIPTGRPDARSFILFVGNGNFTADGKKLREAKTSLQTNGVQTIVLGTGSDVSIEQLESLTEDPFNVFIISEETFENLRVIPSYFVYSDCDLEKI